MNPFKRRDSTNDNIENKFESWKSLKHYSSKNELFNLQDTDVNLNSNIILVMFRGSYFGLILYFL